MQKFNEIYRRIGELAATAAVPISLAQDQDDAVTIAQQVRIAEIGVTETQHAERAAGSPLEKARIAVEVTHARKSLDELQARVASAYIKLGIACVEHGFFPPGTDALVYQLEQLQR